MTKTITIARGDGIGPEIMDATLRIFEAAGVDLNYDEIEIGKAVYESGASNGIEPESWETLRKNGIFFKAPITTPQGGGFKSLNVTVRKSLGLFANVRPCVTYAPYVESAHPNMDLVIVRENEEDLYGGIEHRQTQNTVQCLKLITREGCERICRFAFEYARAYGRKKVTCMTKDNIMKQADGLFHEVFNEVGKEYSDIEQDHYIIDIGTARIASSPEIFDVIVTLNLYGDIISDVAAEITGSVGLAGSSNIGADFGMFEAIHGSAPDIAGKGIANPSGLLMGGVMMLVHLGLNDAAEKINNAWLKTIEDGIHTGDIYQEGQSTAKVGTDDFADAVIERLGQKPVKLPAVSYGSGSGEGGIKIGALTTGKKETKVLNGVDIFLDWVGKPDDLADALGKHVQDGLTLEVIANRGVKVWPDGNPGTSCADHWQVRYSGQITHGDILKQLEKVSAAGFEFVKTELLYTFDDQRGYSVAQGQ